MMISNGLNQDSAIEYIESIERYKELVNPNVRVFSCDLRGYQESKNIMSNLAERNFIRIYGGNSSILKFISQVEGDQIEYIRTFAQSLAS